MTYTGCYQKLHVHSKIVLIHSLSSLIFLSVSPQEISGSLNHVYPQFLCHRVLTPISVHFLQCSQCS